MQSFSVVYNSIFKWKGFGSFKEQENYEEWDSFCHLIIAEGIERDRPWIIAVDQGLDSGTSITNCVSFLAPLVCEKLKLDPLAIKWIEVYNHEERTIDEVVIKNLKYVYYNQPKITFNWQPCNLEDRNQVEKIILTAGQKVII
ncbi:hypothetical protein [Desulfospira joergensenii]|uniref:hypothetical protein n=1 Tax=Desulfospira joergensenii TaxID=53329 RepID=UPI0003B4844E|nr:hypothetical protein [Desulfospira joergensenii]